MIKEIINLLIIDNHYNVSARVEFAKGRRELPLTINDFWAKLKRIWKYGR